MSTPIATPSTQEVPQGARASGTPSLAPARSTQREGGNSLGTFGVKSGLAQMLKGGVIMDVVNAEQARIAEEAGACAVMALERVPADIRAEGGVARMSDPKMIKEIVDAVTIPVMAKVRIGHFVEAQGAAFIRTKGEAGTGNVVEAVRHSRAVQSQIRRASVMNEEELYLFAKEIKAPFHLLKETARLKRLPVVNFAAGGIATPGPYHYCSLIIVVA
ncbi:Pyridoxal 5'-phosphate synthase subunit snz1 [Termitomyces sp. T32_za158]|nr:Pyridoxal 5'-phosphate synthase subunit snz1 [Termitomyces sp. T32_za158]